MSLRPAKRMQGIERTLIRQIFDAAPPGAINLGLGQPDLATPSAISLAGVSAIVGGRTSYTSTAGEPALRRAIAALYPGAAGPEGVVVTIGSQEAMFASCLALVDPGQEILYPDPGYPAYPVVARLIGATPVAYPLRPERGFRISAADVEARLTERTRLVILCSPSNPTGACNQERDLRDLVELLRSRGVCWISDEIYSAFQYEDPAPSPATLCPEGGLVVSGLSKTLSMTGWRIGWVAGPPEIVRRIVAAHQYLVTCASSVSQHAALAAFTPAGRAAGAAHLEVFRRRRELMARELEAVRGIRVRRPDGAFYFFVDVSAHGGSFELARRILDRRNVITVPGVAFGANGEGYLRLSFAASEEDIVRGVGGIRDELQNSGVGPTSS